MSLDPSITELRSFGPFGHVREIADDLIDLPVAHPIARKAGHLHGGPTANRFWVANEGVQPVPGHVLRRTHGLIEIRPDGACSGAIQGVTRQALGHVKSQTGANRIGRGQ